MHNMTRCVQNEENKKIYSTWVQVYGRNWRLGEKGDQREKDEGNAKKKKEGRKKHGMYISTEM